MAAQKHLDREHEGGFRLENQRLPHSILIDFKVSACHMLVLLVYGLAAIDEGQPAIWDSRRILSKITNIRQTCHGRVGRTCDVNFWIRLRQERQYSIEIQPALRKAH